VNASVLSAFGTLVSPVRIDLARSKVRVLTNLDVAEREELLDDLRARGRAILEAAGVDAAAIELRYGLDARYLGQGNELTLWFGADRDAAHPAFPASADEVLAAFQTEYDRVYGLSIPGVPIEAVTWRLSAIAPAATVPVASLPAASGPPTVAHRRAVRFDRGHAAADTPVYRRGALAAGHTFEGPAIIEERETTAVIRPGWRAEVHADGTIIATRHVSGEASA